MRLTTLYLTALSLSLGACSLFQKDEVQTPIEEPSYYVHAQIQEDGTTNLEFVLPDVPVTDGSIDDLQSYEESVKSPIFQARETALESLVTTPHTYYAKRSESYPSLLQFDTPDKIRFEKWQTFYTNIREQFESHINAHDYLLFLDEMNHCYSKLMEKSRTLKEQWRSANEEEKTQLRQERRVLRQDFRTLKSEIREEMDLFDSAGNLAQAGELATHGVDKNQLLSRYTTTYITKQPDNAGQFLSQLAGKAHILYIEGQSFIHGDHDAKEKHNNATNSLIEHYTLYLNSVKKHVSQEYNTEEQEIFTNYLNKEINRVNLIYNSKMAGFDDLYVMNVDLLAESILEICMYTHFREEDRMSTPDYLFGDQNIHVSSEEEGSFLNALDENNLLYVHVDGTLGQGSVSTLMELHNKGYPYAIESLDPSTQSSSGEDWILEINKRGEFTILFDDEGSFERVTSAGNWYAHDWPAWKDCSKTIIDKRYTHRVETIE